MKVSSVTRFYVGFEFLRCTEKLDGYLKDCYLEQVYGKRGSGYGFPYTAETLVKIKERMYSGCLRKQSTLQELQQEKTRGKGGGVGAVTAQATVP